MAVPAKSQYPGRTWTPLGIVGLILLTALAQSWGDDSIGETRSTLEKWVETRQLISKTQSDWQADKELLEQSTELFKRELISIEEQFGKLDTNSVQVEKERAQAEAQLRSASTSLENSKKFAEGFESQIKNLTPRLPVPLQEILKPLLARLPANSISTRMLPSERLQVIIGVLNEVDKFNNAVSIFSENVKDQKGAEVAVQTVYLGLGASYFSNDAGELAGTGTPGPNGWEWSVRPELGPSVREVIRIYRNEQPARFIPLPVVIR